MSFKVTNIISAFNSKSGGPPRTVSLIAEAGTGLWRAELFSTDYRESAGDSLLLSNFPGHVNLLPARMRGVWGGMGMLVGYGQYRPQLLHGIAPDVMHLHGMWSLFLAAFADVAIQYGIPYVVAPHGMLEPWSLTVRPLRKQWALKSYQGRILRHAAAVHATSEMEAENLRLLGVKAPIFVIPNIVSEPPFLEAPCGASSDGKRVMLFLSRLHEKKGLDMLLQAWNELRPAGWRMLIVGSGEARYVERLQSFCRTNGVPDVHFNAHVEGEARERIFQMASVFVLPTYSENFGNAVAEALIRGLPVITTTGTPWSELISRQCGWYINPTLEEVKRTIAEATATPEEALKRMGNRGREYATSKFTLPVVRHELLRMYQAAIQTRRKLPAADQTPEPLVGTGGSQTTHRHA